MVGWILGALLVVCDGLVWAELGAALPHAGGPVRYLRSMYGPRVGGWLAFLFVFQLTFSAPLSMASGCIGFAQYAEYLWPALHDTITAQRIPLSIPGVGTTFLEVTITKGTFLAMATVATPSSSYIGASPSLAGSARCSGSGSSGRRLRSSSPV